MNLDNINLLEFKDFDDENKASQDEITKISNIKFVSYRKPEKKEGFFSSIASIFKPKSSKLTSLDVTQTRQKLNIDPLRRLGLSKVLTINNISGVNAWVLLSPSQITSIGNLTINKIGSITLNTSGEHKIQEISIPNNSRSEYDLDNSLSYVTLFLHIDDKWKKVWLDRLFNTRTCNINILEKHVKCAIDFNLLRRN